MDTRRGLVCNMPFIVYKKHNISSVPNMGNYLGIWFSASSISGQSKVQSNKTNFMELYLYFRSLRFEEGGS